jgi:hypothetical protein
MGKFGSGIRNGKIWIRDPRWKKFGSEINIPDPQLLVPMLADILGGFFPNLRQPIGRRNFPIIWQ